MKEMLVRLKCLFGKHDFARVIATCGGVEVRECWNCGTHLNLNHWMQQAYVSRKHSMYWILKKDAESFGKDYVHIYPLKKEALGLSGGK